MATVYVANDLKHDRDVALKVLRAELAATLGSDAGGELGCLVLITLLGWFLLFRSRGNQSSTQSVPRFLARICTLRPRIAVSHCLDSLLSRAMPSRASFT